MIGIVGKSPRCQEPSSQEAAPSFGAPAHRTLVRSEIRFLWPPFHSDRR